MKTGHTVLYSNGYKVSDPAHPDHHVWQAACLRWKTSARAHRTAKASAGRSL